MKRLLYTFTCFAGLIMFSCLGSSDDAGNGFDHGTFRLNYSVLSQDTPTATRASVGSEPGEEDISSLYLLFFEHSEDGSGKFVAPYEVQGPLGMNASIPISFSAEHFLKNDVSYNILAVANLDKSNYVTGNVLEWINSSFTGHTENYAVLYAMAYLQGAANNNEYDDTRAIGADELIMSGSTSKEAYKQEVSLELTRGLVRFDVQNLKKDSYDLVSVSIWNAPVNAPVWTGERYVVSGYLQRFYGLKRELRTDENDPALADIAGGLYSFENFVTNPVIDDKVTTCLIVGLAPREVTGLNYEVTYHRVNMHPSDGGQNLKRNNVYKLAINNVNGEGAGSEYEAWVGGVNNLDIIINNWNLDDNGMVLTDGKNTLVIPVKRVVLNPEGDQREYSVYSLGPGDPYISKIDMPMGVNVQMVNNRLYVDADPLGPTESERRGMIEITLGGLKGEINFIQAPNIELYLTVNKTDIPSFPALGVSPMSDGYLEVTSSGPWTAKIYNNDPDPDNPGFSFNLISTGQTPVTELTYDDNFQSNQFQIYTTGANPSSDPRYAFVMITLDDDPTITRSLVLIQKGAVSFGIIPTTSTVSFLGTGDPQATPGFTNTEGDYVVFTVDPGDDGQGGPLNPWNASIVDGTMFELEVENNTSLGKAAQKIKVKAKGSNISGNPYTGIIEITRSGDTDKITLNISQSSLGFSLSQQGDMEVPAKGGAITGVKVNADASLKWSAKIISQSPALAHGHSAYFVDANGNKMAGTEINGQPMSSYVRIGYDKLLTPNVHVTPTVVVEVSIDNTSLTPLTFTVTQKELTPKSISAININSSNRGIITQGAPTDRYNRWYISALYNSALFGPGGTLYMPAIFNLSNTNWGPENAGTIPSSVHHVNVNRTTSVSAATCTRIDEWRQANEGVLVINDDYNLTASFASDKLFAKLGYTKANHSGRPFVSQSQSNSRVYKYIFEQGPFGAVSIGNLRAMDYDGERLVVHGYPSTAIPIVTDDSGGAQILIDPINRVVFNGELQIFHEGTTYNIGTSPANDSQRFLANFVAFIHNMAMYGTHFTDHFLPGATTDFPFDYTK